MKSFFVRRGSTTMALLGTMALLAACEDKRIQQLDTGISQDSAVSLLTKRAKTTDSDTLPNVYTKEKYLIGGQMHEVMFFSPKDIKPGKDSIDWRKTLTPVVFIGSKLVAKGWQQWDSISTANHIPLKKTGK
jgi:hypothetical protein